MHSSEPFLYRGGGYYWNWVGEGDAPPSDVTCVIVDGGVTTIGQGAFFRCGSNANYGCTMLSSITLSSSVTIIERWAFSRCISLETITLPPSITKVGYGAFSNCTALKSVTGSHAWRVLHRALAGECFSSDFINLVIRLHPEEIEELDQNGKTPLHIAATMPPSSDNIDIIKKLLGAYPDAASVRDDNGNFPLMLAIKSGKTWSDGVQDIFNAFPTALVKKDENGNTPLHIAAAMPLSSDNTDIIKKLLATYRDAASVHDDNGNLPLALAIENGKAWNDGVEDILNAFPPVSMKKDKQSNLYPFMIAASQQSSPCLNSIYELLIICPEMESFYIGLELGAIEDN